MGIIAIAIGAGIIVAGIAVYQLVKSKKAVTVASVVAQAKTDVKSEVKK